MVKSIHSHIFNTTTGYMGIYDTIFSTFDLGQGFWNRELRTEDLYRSLTEYWIDPNGRIWSIDYSDTHDFEDLGRFRSVRTGTMVALPHSLSPSKLVICCMENTLCPNTCREREHRGRCGTKSFTLVTKYRCEGSAREGC